MADEMTDETARKVVKKEEEVNMVEQDDDVEDEEEEVYSSEHNLSAPSPSAASLSTSFSGHLVLSPRRCVSRELLEQMPALSISSRYYEVSIAKPFGVFHLMQLIEKSIQVGALFTPKLYVPKEIWQQDRVKLAGIPLKLEVFQSLKQGIEKVSVALPITSEQNKAAFIAELEGLLEFAKLERIQLSRSFPFIPVDKIPQPATTAKSDPNQQTPANAAAAGIGKLTNLAVGFGRMVKKQAIAAVERVGAAPAVATSFDELEEYAATLCILFNSTRNLEHLIGVRAGADGTQEEVNAASPSEQLDPEVLERLKELAIFLDEVVVELVMRDLQSLLETYLRRTTQHFGEFTIEQALMKHAHRQSVSA
ncbi:hypothetical protein Poli38472_003652 [Pythium oligandrum]|uniref:Uncharacterized protein n=1 Tax=Pythium oligandrum TaxID=41045 RepID=A0A8K1CLU6_PYTOL|nr:hypothetical protein Poli38472_003652 [Pythium oligandrum]|eukprot:TMW65887.1 hypothetical protein Poli38472_003652 [Pythium oligandrum]